MRLVIDIPEEMYIDIKEEVRTKVNTSDHIPFLHEVISVGTPLPKGHGRLIDADALEKKMCDREEELGDDRAMWESSAVSVALDMFALTIIEADKTEIEGKYEANRKTS